MNRSEFNDTFAKDFQVRFPDDWGWLLKHTSTWALWFHETFCAFAVAEALDASRGFSIGAYVGWNAFSRADIPKHYRRVVGKARADRRNAEANVERKAWDRQQRGQNALFAMADANAPEGQRSMLSAYRELRKMTLDGADEATQRAFVDDCFPG